MKVSAKKKKKKTKGTNQTAPLLYTNPKDRFSCVTVHMLWVHPQCDATNEGNSQAIVYGRNKDICVSSLRANQCV